MAELFGTILYSKIFWITFVLISLHVYLKKTIYSYWQRHGIPHDEFTVPFGIFGKEYFMKKSNIGNVLRSSYEKFKKYPFHGIYMFNNRVLMINDLELIKQMLVKDFASFRDRGLYCNTEIDPLSGNLAFLNGNKWKTLRTKLSPTFTPGKLKQMYSIFNDVTNNMILVMHENLIETNIIEMKDITARFTLDVIFSLAFGFDSETLMNPNSELYYYGKLAFKTSVLKAACGLFAPKLLYALRQPYFSPEVTKFFVKLFQDMVEKRRAGEIKRQDYLDSLIDLMDHDQIIDAEMESSSGGIATEKLAKRLELLEGAAQAFVFLAAGFESSSSLAAHCLYELALNPEAQEKVHKEIDELQNNSESLSYDNLMELEYLDMVFLETSRKHPPLPFLNRISINDYKMPNSEYTVPSGMNIIISVSGLHMDPDIYPEPQKFNPERFSKENVASRHPYCYLPFGEGPRICIGKRLGILQSKMALFHLLSNYKFSVCDKTPIPSFYSPNTFVQSPRDGINLKVEKRKII